MDRTEDKNLPLQKNNISVCAWSDYCPSDLLNFPHHVVAEHTLHSKAVGLFCDRKLFPFSTSRLMPFISPSAAIADTNSLNGDLVSSLVHQKSEWTNHMDRLSKLNSKKFKYKYAVDMVQTALSTQLDEVILPSQAVQFLELLGQDPDSDFSGPTNWYYAGGRLSHLAIDDQSILLSSSGKNNEKLYVIPLREESSQGWQPVPDASNEMATTSNTAIHQIASQVNAESGLIGVLQKKLCSLYNLRPEMGSFELRGCHCVTSTKPFTSLDISKDYFGRYCTSSVDRQAILWDAFSCKCIQSDVVNKPKYTVAHPWSSIQFLGPNTLIMADTCSVSWLDIRMPLSTPSMVFYPRDQPSLLAVCEDISLVFPSSPSFETLLIGLSHHLINFDYRNTNVSQRWTHMMRSPPIYAQTWKTNDENVICIANQEPAEVELIINNVSKTNCISTILPYMLPTLHESLHSYHMDGLFLDPRVQQRLKMSLTGVTCISSNDGKTTQLLSQTALGDIFCQELKTTEITKLLTPENIEHLKVWEKNVISRHSNSGQKLRITGEQNFSEAYKSFRNVNYKMSPYQRVAAIQKSLRPSKKELLSYVDVLAPKLLSAWNIMDLPERDYGRGLTTQLPLRSDITRVAGPLISRTVDDQQCDVPCNNVESLLATDELLEPVDSVLHSPITSRSNDSFAHKNVDEAYDTPLATLVNERSARLQASRKKSNVTGF